MKKTALLLSVFFLSVALSAHAQTGAASTPPPYTDKAGEVVNVTPEQQKAMTDALALADKVKLEADAAAARLETAQARAQGLLYQIMALLKISPADYDPVFDQQGLHFKRKPSPSDKTGKE